MLIRQLSPDKWEFSYGRGSSIYTMQNGSIVALFKYDGLYYEDIIPDGTTYTFSLEFRNEGLASQFGGFLLNWSNESESDRAFYNNNGINSDGAHTIPGHSGIGFLTYDSEKGTMSYREAKKLEKTGARDTYN